jgi:copper(I)-binding protein
MNRPDASNDARVVVPHRQGNILVLQWTKIRRISSTKSMNNGKFTTFVPTSSLQSIHLVSATSAIMDNDELQRHIEKQMSSDMNKCEKNRASV